MQIVRIIFWPDSDQHWDENVDITNDKRVYVHLQKVEIRRLNIPPDNCVLYLYITVEMNS